MNTFELASQEWITLQNNYEQYEKGGLLIKLFGLVLTATGIALGLNEAVAVALILVLWGQESICRTFQSRVVHRLLRVEDLIKQAETTEDRIPNSDGTHALFQLHSEWLAGRKCVLGLVTEYATNACKPTVAYPYVVLIVVLIANCWLG